MNNTTLWKKLEQKFCVELRKNFSDRNIRAWLDHFKPNTTIRVFQYGKDATGKSGKGKHISVYTGSWLKALLRLKVPAQLMAKSLFSRLTKQNYSHSDIYLIGIHSTPNMITAHIGFDRYNNLQEKYHSARGLYKLEEINNTLLITEMHVFDSDEDLKKHKLFKPMWNPNGD